MENSKQHINMGVRNGGVVRVDMDLVHSINEISMGLVRIQSDIEHIKSDIESISIQLSSQKEEIIKINMSRNTTLKCLGWAYDHAISLLLMLGTVGTFIYQFVKKSM